MRPHVGVVLVAENSFGLVVFFHDIEYPTHHKSVTVTRKPMPCRSRQKACCLVTIKTIFLLYFDLTVMPCYKSFYKKIFVKY